jgi:hypothetical protein
MKIAIDKQFKTLFRPLTDEENHQLEANILKDGIRDPLVLWGNILIDGYNRYTIAQKHHLKFGTEKDFKDKTEAEIWIRTNQKGRRNLTSFEKTYNIGKLYELTKNRQGGDHKSKGHHDQLKNTALDLSEKFGVGEKTIRRAAEFVKEIDAIGEVDSEIKDRFLSGAIRATQKNIKIFANMEPIKQKKIIEALKELPVFSQARKQVEIGTSKDEKKRQIIEATKRNPPKVYRMDCVDFIKTCEPYDLLLTDPPYSTDVTDIDAFVHRWLFPALNKLKPTGSAFICIGAYPEELQAYFDTTIPDHVVLKQILVWYYKNVPMVKLKGYRQTYCNILLYRGKKSLIDIDDPTEGWAVHDDPRPDVRWGTWFDGWQKPMSLAEKFIRHSTKKGDLVVDPFVGTGTFVLAASKLGRNGIGSDIDEEHLKIAESRGCKLIK